MKAFFVGLTFLCAVAVLAGVGLLLYPLLFLMAFLMRFILSLLLVFVAIWALGKFIMFAWEKIFHASH